MGTGKSSSGRVLARKLGYEFIDSDTMIEMQQGISVTDIFQQLGEPAFRTMETQACKELAQREGLVIATGGKMMLDEKNAEILGSTGRVFCLTADQNELIQRLSRKTARQKRPLLHDKDLEQYVAHMLEERGAAYARFTQIDTTGKKPYQVANIILSKLRKRPPFKSR